MKKLSLLTASVALLFAVNTSVNATTNTTMGEKLKVVNTWNNTIHVKEGTLLSKESDIYPGSSVNWTMLSGAITNLSISYYKNGSWQNIPGCANGNFYSNLTVYVAPAPWDANTPICHTA
jgi:hypothetical protein